MGEHDGDSACAQCGHEKRVHYFHHRHGPRHPDRGMPVHCDGIDAGYAWSECLCPGFYPAPPDPRDAEIARLKAEMERVTEVARLLVGECEEHRECPVCGTDTNVEVCRPSCYVAKMRKVLDGGKVGG